MSDSNPQIIEAPATVIAPTRTPEQLLAEAVIQTAQALAEKTERERNSNKEALKEALKEWMDEKFALFGKWSLGAIAAWVLGGLIYLFIVTHGFKIG